MTKSFVKWAVLSIALLMPGQTAMLAADMSGLELEAMDYRCNKYSPKEKAEFVKKYGAELLAEPRSEKGAWLRCFCVLHSKDHVAAQQEAQRLIKKFPGLAAPHLFSAVMEMHNLEDSAALGQIAEAIKIRPNFFNAYWIRSTIYLNTGELKLALADVDKAYALCHSEVIRIILTERADLEFRLKNYDQAIADAKLCIQKYVQPLSHNYDVIMHSYVQKQNWPEVAKVATQVEKLYPTSKYYKFARSTANYKLGKYPQALKDVQKFMENAGDARIVGEQKEAVALRADIYEKLGKKGMAAADRDSLKRDDESIYKDTIFMNK